MEISILDLFEHFSSKNRVGHFFKFFCQNWVGPNFVMQPFPRKWTQRGPRPHFWHQKGLNFQLFFALLSFFEYFYFSKSILSKNRFHQKFSNPLKKKKKKTKVCICIWSSLLTQSGLILLQITAQWLNKAFSDVNALKAVEPCQGLIKKCDWNVKCCPKPTLKIYTLGHLLSF